MSALGLLGGLTRPPSTPTRNIPYPFPSAPPYNVPVHALIPTPDGTGRALHPDVVVFPQPWNGYRFWMAVTPYYLGGDDQENPCILVSHDGYQWHNPPGLTNPIDPWPGADPSGVGGYIGWYNSDTDMIYDATANELVVIWREVLTNEWERIYLSHSGDGITWAKPVLVLEALGTTEDLIPSPSIIKVAENDWRMYAVHSGTAPDRMYHSATRTGTYGTPDDLTMTVASDGSAFQCYHGDAIYHQGEFFGIFHRDGGSSDHPAWSSDGITWRVGDPVVTSRGAEWDANVYRPCMAFDPGDGFVHVWYSTLVGTFDTRVGYTRAPARLWTDLRT